jgi:hypothetical protein
LQIERVDGAGEEVLDDERALYLGGHAERRSLA